MRSKTQNLAFVTQWDADAAFGDGGNDGDGCGDGDLDHFSTDIDGDFEGY